METQFDFDRFNRWLKSATLSKLEIEHATLNRWLGMSNARLWEQRYADSSRCIKAIWQEICARREADQFLEAAE